MATIGWADTLANIIPPASSRMGEDGLASAFDHDANAWERVTNQLLDIRRLGPDWDGDSAPAPSTAVTDSALRLLPQLRRGDCPAPARAVASLDGTVVLEWQWSGGMIQLEVIAPGRAEGTFHRRGQPAKHLTVGW